MTLDYDAKAIAEVMGLAFQRYPGTAPSSQGDDGLVIFIAGKMYRIVATTILATRDEDMITNDHLWIGTVSDSFSHLLPSSFMIERAVASGLPSIAHRNVLWAMDGSPPMDQGAAAPPLTERLSLADSERTERIARLFVHARRALGSEAEARQFMTTPHPELNNRAPMEMAETDLGTRHAEHILNTLEFGLAV